MGELVPGGTWEHARNHYNVHAERGFGLSTQKVLQQRNEGPAQELKHFHNHVKRQLLWRFTQKLDRLLDLCCGRGGDLQKWRDAQIKYVRGLDISEREVDEARRRYDEMVRKQRGPGPPPPRCEFEAVDWLGERLYEDPLLGPGAYGAVTCMFALHYFFVAESSLRTFLGNVAANLRNDGYFIGTIPSGHRVLELLGDKSELRTPMLRLVKKWRGSRPTTFGAGYICDIADTVTASLEGTTEGSLEYLVDLPTLERLAAEAGLFPVRDYLDPVLMSCFEQEDIDAPFKRFKPFFLHSLQLDAVPKAPPPLPPSSLEKASSLFVAFVFQKTSSPQEVTVPLAEECSYLKPAPVSRGPGGPGGPGEPHWGGGHPPPLPGPDRHHPMMGMGMGMHGGPPPPHFDQGPPMMGMGHHPPPGGPQYGQPGLPYGGHMMGGGGGGGGPPYGGPGGGHGHGYGQRPGGHGPGGGKRARYGGPPPGQGGNAYG